MRAGHGLRMLLTSLVCAGCTGLLDRPGHDFSVRVLDESPIDAVELIYAPVRFAVDGCAAFDLDLENAAGERRPLTLSTQPDGTYVAAVPVAVLMADSFCSGSFLPAVNEVDHGTLVATCRDAGRSARATFSVHPGLGGGWGSQVGDIRAVFPGVPDVVPWWIATSDHGGEVGFTPGGFLGFDWAPTLNPAAYRNALVRPRLVRRDTRAFATLGCEAGAGCPQVLLGPGELVRGERVAEFEVSETYARVRMPRGIATVASNVVDMAFAADGALVVVSDSSVGRGPPQFDENGVWIDDDGLRWGETTVWRVTPAPEGAQGVVEDEATLIARLPRETVVSRLARTSSGALSFATAAYAGVYTPGWSLNLHVTDGSTVSRTYTASNRVGCSQEAKCMVRLAAAPFVNPGIYLSPDGSSLIVAGITGTLSDDSSGWFWWVDTGQADPEWQEFGRNFDYFGRIVEQPVYKFYASGGAAWLPGAVALWTGAALLSTDQNPGLSRVQVFEASPPRTLRYSYDVEALPGPTTRPALVGVIAVNDHLVLTTTTGVRILDASGSLVGGMDPLPCGARVTAAAEQIGPTKVAVGVGDLVVSFTVGP